MMAIICFIILQILFDVFIVLGIRWINRDIYDCLSNHKEVIQKILDCLTKR